MWAEESDGVVEAYFVAENKEFNSMCWLNELKSNIASHLIGTTLVYPNHKRKDQH